MKPGLPLPPQGNNEKNNANRRIGLIIAVAGFMVGLALVVFAMVKLRPPSPPDPSLSASSTIPLPVPTPADPSPPSYDTELLKDKLFITTQRSAYQAGQMVLKIPCMGVDKAVQDGTTDELMDIGPGLYDYAQLPTEKDGNVSIVAHRDIAGSEFYFAHKLGAGDLFYLIYNDTIFVYAYKITYIVEPDDWGPIYLQGYPCLTLTTCHPIGSTRQRLIAHAELVETVPFDPNYHYAPWVEGIIKPYTWEPDATSWDNASAPSSSQSVSAPASSEPSPVPPASTSASSTSDASPIVTASASATTRDATPLVLTPTASGTTVLGNSTVSIDVSNSSQGYIMVRYTGSNSNVKLQITADSGTTYTYNLSGNGSYDTFTLVSGSSGYTVNVFENVSGDQYAQLCGEHIEVNLTNPLLPFLHPNQYVNFQSSSDTVSRGAALASTATTDLEVVENVYNWVIKNINYDFDKATIAAAGQLPRYLPNVDAIVSSGKGICFDYAAVMATMLRTQRIPTKLVIGYAGTIYHAWISVYITDVGWINDIIYFDGKSWNRLDPTFASSENSSKDIMQYINNDNNYNAMLIY